MNPIMSLQESLAKINADLDASMFADFKAMGFTDDQALDLFAELDALDISQADEIDGIIAGAATRAGLTGYWVP